MWQSERVVQSANQDLQFVKISRMLSYKFIILCPLALLIAVVVFRAVFLFKPVAPPKSCIESHKDHKRIVLNQAILNRFKDALNIPTISYGEGRYEPVQLIRLIDHIESSFPAIHGAPFVKKELVANYTLLYTVEGTNKNLRPYLLTSHLDVVPAVLEKWSSDPFNATIKSDNNIYARGTIDAKHLLMGMLEAFEFMLKKGFRPKRSFYLVFGHDEEIGGTEGAQEISKILERRLRESNWQNLEYVLDEGLTVSRTKVLGIEADIGLIGVVEKGYANVKISTVGAVGHGSMPPSQTAITKLSTAIGKFHSHLMPSFLGESVEREMIDIFARHATWPYKLFYANFWLFKPIFQYIFSNDPSMNSLIRTSTAVTMVQGGIKENVLPESASAFINHRIHPKQTCQEILEFDRRLIDDPTIQVEFHGPRKEPSPVAPYCDDCYAYQLLKHSLLQIYPNTVIVPGVFLAASDSRWYIKLTDAIYKFSAISVHLDELNRFHGHDERISLTNYENLINFYHHLIQNSDASKLNLRPKRTSDEL